MILGRFTYRGSPELEATLRRMVVIFRFLGWVWMLLLVAVTMSLPVEDAFREDPRLWIVWAAVGLATVWTFLTWYMARSHPEALSGWVWFVFDSLAMLAIGAASVAAGANELFHGGLPLSYVFVGALFGGLPGSLIAATFLAFEQFAVHVIADLGAVRAAGSIIFFIVATIVGWTFDKLRSYDIARQVAQDQLAEEQAASAVLAERNALAVRLHDSVLQTLHAIRMGADDPNQSRYLARRQERELRRNIEGLTSEHDESFRTALLTVRDEIEDVHRVEIDAVIRDDAEMSPSLAAGINAAREAMTNAAKHSGSPNIDLYAEISDDRAHIHVRDRGVGFSNDQQEAQVHRRLTERVADVDGSIVVDSSEDQGTEVSVTVDQ